MCTLMALRLYMFAGVCVCVVYGVGGGACWSSGCLLFMTAAAAAGGSVREIPTGAFWSHSLAG